MKKDTSIRAEQNDAYIEVVSDNISSEIVSSDGDIQNVSDPTSIIDSTEIIDIEVDAAFPYVSRMDLEGELEDKDILIDGGFAESGNNETIGLLEVLENCATVGSDTTVNHAQLNGKDAPDSHPISAITGLKEKIDELTRVG